MKHPARRFTKAVARAIPMPAPARLAATILADPVDNGLRAASYDGRVTGTGIRVEVDEDGTEYAVANSQPERLLERTRPDTRHQRNDLRALNRAAITFCDSVATLVAVCADKGAPAAEDYTWEWALSDAHLLTETQHAPGCTRGGCGCVSLVEAAEEVSMGTDAMADAVRALTRIEGLWKRYHPHRASAWEQYKRAHPTASPEELCSQHAALRPPIYKPVHGAGHLCKTCADLRREAGGIDPPPSLIQLLEDGKQSEYRKARSRWLAECEEDARAARRQGCA